MYMYTHTFTNTHTQRCTYTHTEAYIHTHTIEATFFFFLSPTETLQHGKDYVTVDSNKGKQWALSIEPILSFHCLESSHTKKTSITRALNW